MAEKSSQLILDALSRAVLDPDGSLLHGNKSTPGLFATTAAAKQAARRCKEEGLLQVIGTETKGKTFLERCTITDKGIAHLLSEAHPRHVLEDFVRVLESRQSQIQDVARSIQHTQAETEALCRVARQVLHQIECSGQAPNVVAAGRHSSNGLGVDDWQEAALDRLAQWRAAGASEDCPLPLLHRELLHRRPALTIGQFHDGLRRLHEATRIYLHPWTGPLYDLPEPQYALLIGHEILYYASLREAPRNGEIL